MAVGEQRNCSNRSSFADSKPRQRQRQQQAAAKARAAAAAASAHLEAASAACTPHSTPAPPAPPPPLGLLPQRQPHRRWPANHNLFAIAAPLWHTAADLRWSYQSPRDLRRRAIHHVHGLVSRYVCRMPTIIVHVLCRRPSGSPDPRTTLSAWNHCSISRGQ